MQLEDRFSDAGMALSPLLLLKNGDEVCFSVERNTIKLEGPDETPRSQEFIAQEVAKEVQYSLQFLKADIPISITCYVGGERCTKQADLLKTLLAYNPSFAPLITPHLTCNFSVKNSEMYIRELHELGISHVLALSGDKLTFTDFKRELKEAPELAALVRSVEQDLRRKNGWFTPTDISVAYSSFRSIKGKTEQERFIKKLRAGATSIKTQPLTYLDHALVRRDVDFLRQYFPPEASHQISLSVIYYQTLDMAKNIGKYGIKLDPEVLDLLNRAHELGLEDGTSKSRVYSEGLHIAAKSIAGLIDSGLRSINLMGVKKPQTYAKLLSLVPMYLRQNRPKIMEPRAQESEPRSWYRVAIG